MSPRPNISKRYVISLILFSTLLILVAVFINFWLNSRNLLKMLEKQSEVLLLSIVQSSENAVISYQEIEFAITDKLLDNAYLIAKLDAEKELTQQELQEIAFDNSIYRINLFDQSGNKELSSAEEPHETKAKYSIKKELEPILSGEVDYWVLGLKEARYEEGHRFAVAVKRQKGGAVVVNIDADTMLEFRKLVGVGGLLKSIGNYQDVVYIAIQDELGILAATPNVSTLSSFEHDKFLEKAMENHKILNRRTQFNGKKILELVRHFHVDNEPIGIVRLGISLASYEEIIRRSFINIFIIFLLLLLTDMIAIKFIFDSINKHLEHISKLEHQIEQQRRLSAMGKLAAGLAHEIRNPLNAVGMIAQRFQLEFQPREDVEEYQSLAKTIRSEIKRLSQIIQQFLEFARPPALNFSEVNLSRLMDDRIKILEVDFRDKNIEIIKNYQENPIIWGDANQLKQVFLNLLLNASQAIQGQGKISIQISEGKGFGAVEIKDNGMGMTEEVRQKIFDLYFTTKNDGTGLGLSIVHRIISAHNGEIFVESELGLGTTFAVKLPLA